MHGQLLLSLLHTVLQAGSLWQMGTHSFTRAVAVDSATLNLLFAVIVIQQLIQHPPKHSSTFSLHLASAADGHGSLGLISSHPLLPILLNLPDYALVVKPCSFAVA